MGRLLVVLTVLASLAVAISTEPASAAAPSLRLVTYAPFTLRGAGFEARERVRLTLTTRALMRRTTLRANARGGFTYRSSLLVAVEPCRGTVAVTAVGLASGARASWKRICRPPDEWPRLLVARRAA